MCYQELMSHPTPGLSFPMVRYSGQRIAPPKAGLHQFGFHAWHLHTSVSRDQQRCLCRVKGACLPNLPKLSSACKACDAGDAT